MAEQHPHQQAALQHLAYLQQEGSEHQAVLVHQRQLQAALEHNPWAAEAALEAHLVRLQQEGLEVTQHRNPRSQ